MSSATTERETGMDWDDAYANAAYIPDAADFPPRWARQSAAFRAALGDRAQIGLRYGDSDRQVFDLFHPEAVLKGTVVFVHGGYWRAFDRSIWSHLAAGPLGQGWSVAMPSYDLCPEVRIGQITRQIADAVQDIAARTTGPISLTGHSAGGHLVARMLDPSLTSGSLSARLHRVVPISPLSDLRPLMRTAMNADFQLTEQEARAESPVLMTKRHDTPVSVWVGGQERPAFLDQAGWLVKAWGAAHVIVPDRHHFDVIDALADAKSDLVSVLTS